MSDLKFDIWARDHTGRTFDNVGRKIDGIGGKFKKFGAIAVAGAAVAGAAVAAFAVSAVKAGAADQASQAKLAQTLKKTQKARAGDIKGVEKWIDATSRASGIADDELRPALSNLLIAGESTAKSQKDVALAMDIAAAKGLPLASVTKAMAKAHLGNVGALGRLGIATKDAAGKTLSYKDILEKARKTMGGASAAAADTFQGKMKRLGVAFQEAKESIGTALLPILTKLIDWILKTAIPALGKFWAWFQEKILPTLKELAGKVMEGVRNGLKSIGDAIERNKPQLQQLWEGFKKVADFIVTKVAPLYGKYLKFLFEAIGKGIGFVIDTIGFLIDMAPKIINNFIRPVVSAFLTFASLIVGAAATAFGWVPGLGGKLKKAKQAIDNFKEGADRALGLLADSMGRKGETAGTNYAKGLARGLAKANGVSMSVGKQKASQLVHVNLPPMAKGGSVFAGQAYQVGEKGVETFVPEQNGTILPHGARGGRGMTVVVNINGSVLSDERKIGDAVRRALRSGANAGVAIP